MDGEAAQELTQTQSCCALRRYPDVACADAFTGTAPNRQQIAARWQGGADDAGPAPPGTNNWWVIITL